MPAHRPLLLVTAVAALALGGCGSGSGGTATTPSADRATADPHALLTQMQAALAHVDGYHVAGVQKDKSGRSSFTGDVTSKGGVDVELKETGDSLRLIVPDGTNDAYIKADRRFWRKALGTHAPGIATVLADRWIKSPTSLSGDLEKGLRQLLPKELAYCADKNLGPLTNLGVLTLRGKRQVVIHDAGGRPGTTPGNLYLPVTGPMLPLGARQTGRSRPGPQVKRCADDGPDTTTSSVITFSRYDTVPPIAAPPDALDLSTIGSGGGSIA